MMRFLLVQCAHCILKRNAPDSDLKRWGTGVRSRIRNEDAVSIVERYDVPLDPICHRLHLNEDSI